MLPSARLLHWITAPTRDLRWVDLSPDGGTARPRSATIVITKNDGGVIGS